jgi:uncharacterized membrane protein
MTIAELLTKDELRPCDLKRLGKRVHLFSVDDTFTAQPKPGDYVAAKQTVQERIEGFIAETTKAQQAKGIFTEVSVWTGHHSETDWSRVYYWQKGWHFVNKTNDYAVITA